MIANSPTSTPDPSLTDLVARRRVRVLGVWAHPDDEAYLSAGLNQRVRTAGGRAVVLTATRGEAGVPPDDPRLPSIVAFLREQELRRSLAEVGAELLDVLGHRDGACSEIPHEAGVAEVLAAMHEVRPEVVVTFGPDGITGHPDHLAVHRWVTDACARRRSATLLYATMTDDFLDRHAGLHHAHGVFGEHGPVGVPAEEVSFTVELDDRELDVKRRALAAHASQTVELARAMGEAPYREWWRIETFRRPTPREVAAATAPSITGSLDDVGPGPTPARQPLRPVAVARTEGTQGGFRMSAASRPGDAVSGPWAGRGGPGGPHGRRC